MVLLGFMDALKSIILGPSFEYSICPICPLFIDASHRVPHLFQLFLRAFEL